MSGRLPTHLRVAVMMRRVNEAGGAATVVAKGDAEAGAVLIQTISRGMPGPTLERGIGPNGRAALISVGPASSESLTHAEWLSKRRRQDPDMWIVELDIAEAERFAAETMLDD